jgi:xylose isomerase
VKFDQDLVFGHGDLINAFSLVHLLEFGNDGKTRYQGMRHFDYKPSRTEDYNGVWASAEANIRMYLLLKERAAAFEADPEVKAAKAAARVEELKQPTLNPGEGYAELLAAGDGGFEPDAYFNGKGFNFVCLNQLAIEHLMGAR